MVLIHRQSHTTPNERRVIVIDTCHCTFPLFTTLRLSSCAFVVFSPAVKSGKTSILPLLQIAVSIEPPIPCPYLYLLQSVLIPTVYTIQPLSTCSHMSHAWFLHRTLWWPHWNRLYFPAAEIGCFLFETFVCGSCSTWFVWLMSFQFLQFSLQDFL